MRLLNRSDEVRAGARADLEREAAKIAERLAEIDAEQAEVDAKRHADAVETARKAVAKIQRTAETVRGELQDAREILATAEARIAERNAAAGLVALGEMSLAEGEAREVEIDAAIADASRELARRERAALHIAERLAEAGRALAELLPDAEGEAVRVATDPAHAVYVAEQARRRKEQVEWAAKSPNYGLGQVAEEIREEARVLAAERRREQLARHDANPFRRAVIERAQVVPARPRRGSEPEMTGMVNRPPGGFRRLHGAPEGLHGHLSEHLFVQLWAGSRTRPAQ